MAERIRIKPLKKIPKALVKKYPKLIREEIIRIEEMILKEDAFGSILQMKDTYEVIVKVVVILCAYFYYDFKVANGDVISRIKIEKLKEIKSQLLREKGITGVNYIDENGTEYLISSVDLAQFEQRKDVLQLLLQKQLSLGDWRSLLLKMSSKKAKIPIPDELRSIAQSIGARITVSGDASDDGFDLVQWRNKEIGHGALKSDKSVVMKDIIEKYNHLHSLLAEIDSNFTKIEFDFEPEHRLKLNISENHRTDSISERNIFFRVNKGKWLNIFPLMQYLDEGIYIFDTFIPYKRVSFLIDYNQGNRREEQKALMGWLSNIETEYNLDQKTCLGSFDEDVLYFDDEEFVKTMKETNMYNPPMYLLDKVVDFIEINDKGIICVQMMAGMGKTVFSKAMDQDNPLYGVLIDDDIYICKAIYLNGLFAYQEKLFLKQVQRLFEKDKYFKDIQMRIADSGNMKNLSEYLELVQKRMGKKIIIVLDGLDEVLTINGDSIFDCLPNPEILPKDVYIVITSRIENEYIYHQRLSDIEKSGSSLIKVLPSDPEYIQFCTKFLFENMDNNEIKKFISPYMGEPIITVHTLKEYIKCFGSGSVPSKEELFESYIKRLISESKLNRYSRDVKNVVVTLSMVDVPITFFELKHLTGLLFNDIELLGILNDISSILRVEKTEAFGVRFSSLHSTWREKIRNEFSEDFNQKRTILCEQILKLNENEIRFVLNSKNKEEINSKIPQQRLGYIIAPFLISANLLDLQEMAKDYRNNLGALCIYLNGYRDLTEEDSAEGRYLKERKHFLTEQLQVILKSEPIDIKSKSVEEHVFAEKVESYLAIYAREYEKHPEIVKTHFDRAICHNTILKQCFGLAGRDRRIAENLNSKCLALRKFKEFRQALYCLKNAVELFSFKEDDSLDDRYHFSQIRSNIAIDVRNDFFESRIGDEYNEQTVLEMIELNAKETIRHREILKERNYGKHDLEKVYNSYAISLFQFGVYEFHKNDLTPKECNGLYKNHKMLIEQSEKYVDQIGGSEKLLEAKSLFMRSIDFYRKAREERQAKSQRIEAGTYWSMGRLCDYLRDVELASDYYELAINTIRDIVSVESQEELRYLLYSLVDFHNMLTRIGLCEESNIKLKMVNSHLKKIHDEIFIPYEGVKFNQSKFQDSYYKDFKNIIISFS